MQMCNGYFFVFLYLNKHIETWKNSNQVLARACKESFADVMLAFYFGFLHKFFFFLFVRVINPINRLPLNRLHCTSVRCHYSPPYQLQLQLQLQFQFQFQLYEGLPTAPPLTRSSPPFLCSTTDDY